jgi:hypothetical protein
MPDTQEKKTATREVKTIEYSIVADAKLKLRTALKSLVWKRLQCTGHLIDLPLDIRLNVLWECIELFAKHMRPDLQRKRLAHPRGVWRAR